MLQCVVFVFQTENLVLHFFLEKLGKQKERWIAFKWIRMMSLNLDGDIYLKTPQNYEFECLGNASASWGCFPAANFSEKETRDSLLLNTLAEPGATASRHRDMRGFSWPWSLQATACASLTGNFGPTLQYQIPGQHKEGKLLQHVVFSHQNWPRVIALSGILLV